MAVEVILDADDGWAPEELPPVNIRIDGTVYEAHCPKDGLPLLLARIQNRVQDDPSAVEEIIQKALEAILEPEDATELVERVADMTDHKVTLAYMLHVISKVRDHYAPELDKQYADLGVQGPTRREPADRAPARRTSTKKSPAARTATRRR